MPEIRQPWLISSLPPSPAHKRAALVVSTLLLVAFAIAVPFARVMLPQLDIYIPLVAAVMFLNDLITTSLLLAQFSIVRSRALLFLANGYLFTALIVAVYGLVWPGAFHPTGLFGAGPQTRPWLYIAWYAGLATSVIVYALLKSKEHKTPPVARDSVRTFIFTSITCNVLFVCGLTWFVTRFEDFLPVLMTPLNRATEFSQFRKRRYFVCCHRRRCLAVEKAATVGARPVAVGRDTGMAIGFNHVERCRRPLRCRLVRHPRLLNCVGHPCLAGPPSRIVDDARAACHIGIGASSRTRRPPDINGRHVGDNRS